MSWVCSDAFLGHVQNVVFLHSSDCAPWWTNVWKFKIFWITQAVVYVYEMSVCMPKQIPAHAFPTYSHILRHEDSHSHSIAWWLLDNLQTYCNSHIVCFKSMDMPWLRWLVASLLPQRPEFTPVSLHVRFVVDRVALGQVFLQLLQFSFVNIIPL
jgi:hypothetical protein